MNHESEQERSLATLKSAGPILAQDARAEYDRNPHAEIAGVISEKGSPEYKVIRTLIQQKTGAELVPNCLAGIMPLAMVIGIARGGPPQVAEILRDIATATPLMLPVLMCSVNGMQVAGFQIYPPKAAGG